MIRVYKLKHISPDEALRLVQESSVIPYLINWSCNLDEKGKRLIFQLKHGGGDFPEEEEAAAKELDKFIHSIDSPE